MKTKRAFLVVIMMISLLVVACAAPRGDAAKRYEQGISIYCSAPNCNVKITVTTSVAADIKKDQKAEADADISPTVDIAP